MLETIKVIKEVAYIYDILNRLKRSTVLIRGHFERSSYIIKHPRSYYKSRRDKLDS